MPWPRWTGCTASPRPPAQPVGHPSPCDGGVRVERRVARDVPGDRRRPAGDRGGRAGRDRAGRRGRQPTPRDRCRRCTGCRRAQHGADRVVVAGLGGPDPRRGGRPARPESAWWSACRLLSSGRARRPRQRPVRLVGGRLLPGGLSRRARVAGSASAVSTPAAARAAASHRAGTTPAQHSGGVSRSPRAAKTVASTAMPRATASSRRPRRRRRPGPARAVRPRRGRWRPPARRTAPIRRRAGIPESAATVGSGRPARRRPASPGRTRRRPVRRPGPGAAGCPAGRRARRHRRQQHRHHGHRQHVQPASSGEAPSPVWSSCVTRNRAPNSAAYITSAVRFARRRSGCGRSASAASGRSAQLPGHEQDQREHAAVSAGQHLGPLPTRRCRSWSRPRRCRAGRHRSARRRAGR